MNRRIAVFTNGYSSEFIEHIITGLQKKAKTDGVDIFVFVTYCSANDHLLQNKCQLNLFHLPDPKDFDGAIMLTNTFNFSDENERVCARFQRAGVPMISMEVEVPNMSCIKSENYRGVKDLATHLVEHHNAKKFIYVNGIEGNVENSILFRGVHVAKGASVKNSILMQDTIVDVGSNVDHVICDKDVTISAYKELKGTETFPVYVAKGEKV